MCAVDLGHELLVISSKAGTSEMLGCFRTQLGDARLIAPKGGMQVQVMLQDATVNAICIFLRTGWFKRINVSQKKNHIDKYGSKISLEY